MELNTIIYLSVTVVAIAAASILVMSYLLARSRKSKLELEFADENESGNKNNNSLPSNHLGNKKYYKTNFADTLELKKEIAEDKRKKSKGNKDKSKIERMTRINNLSQSNINSKGHGLSDNNKYNFR